MSKDILKGENKSWETGRKLGRKEREAEIVAKLDAPVPAKSVIVLYFSILEILLKQIKEKEQ